jgi:hypothetical protein
MQHEAVGFVDAARLAYTVFVLAEGVELDRVISA